MVQVSVYLPENVFTPEVHKGLHPLPFLQTAALLCPPSPCWPLDSLDSGAWWTLSSHCELHISVSVPLQTFLPHPTSTQSWHRTWMPHNNNTHRLLSLCRLYSQGRHWWGTRMRVVITCYFAHVCCLILTVCTCTPTFTSSISISLLLRKVAPETEAISQHYLKKRYLRLAFPNHVW